MPIAKENYERAIAFLKSHSAHQIVHFNGDLLAHLEGTCHLLDSWGGSTSLCLAGLCHATYGTDGFALSLIDISQRSTLAGVIGSAAERLVYFYASCDRRYLYPQIVRASSSSISFRDRFTGLVFVPDRELFSSFLELTFANELELARRDTEFLAQYGPSLFRLFRRCDHLVSEAAYTCFVNTIREPKNLKEVGGA
jgi:Domain of unknown function (DUF6817)